MMPGLIVDVEATPEILLHNERKLLRKHYGVIFHEIMKIDNSASFWYHTFEIPLRVKNDMNGTKTNCDGDPFGEVNHFKKQEYALFLSIIYFGI